jgi:hypothetical protein
MKEERIGEIVRGGARRRDGDARGHRVARSVARTVPDARTRFRDRDTPRRERPRARACRRGSTPAKNTNVATLTSARMSCKHLFM